MRSVGASALALLGAALCWYAGYEHGKQRGIAAERLRANYIFAEARSVVMGGALWIVAERMFSGTRDNDWMRAELRKYVDEKEARRRAAQ